MSSLALVGMDSEKLDENVYLNNLLLIGVNGETFGFDNYRVDVYSPISEGNGKYYVRYDVKVYKDLNDQWKITGIELKTFTTKK